MKDDSHPLTRRQNEILEHIFVILGLGLPLSAYAATFTTVPLTSLPLCGDETVNGEAAAIYTEINKGSGVSGKA